MAAGAILQNRLEATLPASVLRQFPDRSNLVYGVIPAISDMSQPLKHQSQDAFLYSMRLVWIVMAACSALGLLSVFLVKDLPLARTVDTKWGLRETRDKTSTREAGEVDANPKADVPLIFIAKCLRSHRPCLSGITRSNNYA